MSRHGDPKDSFSLPDSPLDDKEVSLQGSEAPWLPGNGLFVNYACGIAQVESMRPVQAANASLPLRAVRAALRYLPSLSHKVPPILYPV
jgi:hypothetical protein